VSVPVQSIDWPCCFCCVLTVELAAMDISRYSYTIATHYDDGQYYSAWLDFRLRIHNATLQDSGIYRCVLHVGTTGRKAKRHL